MFQDEISIKILFNSMTICCGTLMTYLGINAEAFMLFAVLLAIDYMTGVAKANIIGEAITSTKMKYGVISKLSILIIPLVLAVVAKIVGADFAFVLLVGINILAISEAYSIIGNIYTIKTKKSLPEYDAISAIGRRLRKILEKLDDGQQ